VFAVLNQLGRGEVLRLYPRSAFDSKAVYFQAKKDAWLLPANGRGCVKSLIHPTNRVCMYLSRHPDRSPQAFFADIVG
jgi:hypothetical protein